VVAKEIQKLREKNIKSSAPAKQKEHGKPKEVQTHSHISAPILCASSVKPQQIELPYAKVAATKAKRAVIKYKEEDIQQILQHILENLSKQEEYNNIFYQKLIILEKSKRIHFTNDLQ